MKQHNIHRYRQILFKLNSNEKLYKFAQKEWIFNHSLTPNIAFCKPNGIGVNRVNITTLNALGPDITRSIARPVSFLIILK